MSETKNAVAEKDNAIFTYVKDALCEMGRTSAFCIRFFKEALFPPYEIKELLIQCYNVGYKSLPLVAITGFIMGVVLTLQSRPTLAEFGAESWLPGMVAMSLIREIAPVITALICAGKIASGIGAELGSMKVTEQIDAMEVSSINPFKYLVVTRVMATTLMIPMLVVFAAAIGMVGSYVGFNIHSQMNMFRFFSKAFESVDFSDLIPAIIKTFFFGFAIGIIGCYKGYNASQGTESVGKAANSAVVVASLTIFVLDMLAVQITDLFSKT